MDEIFDPNGKYKAQMDIIAQDMHKMMDEGNL
jgi:hypothetical protein